MHAKKTETKDLRVSRLTQKTVASFVAVLFIFSGIAVPTSFAASANAASLMLETTTTNEKAVPVINFNPATANTPAPSTNVPIPSGAAIQNASPLSPSTAVVSTVQKGDNPLPANIQTQVTPQLLPPVPKGWTRTASNANFAFQVSTKYVANGIYDVTLKVRNLVTGKEQAVSSGQSFPYAHPQLPCDVSPDGSTVVYGYAGAHLASGAPYSIVIQRLDKPSQHKQLDGPLASIRFGKESVVLGTAGAIAPVYTVSLQDLKVIGTTYTLNDRSAQGIIYDPKAHLVTQVTYVQETGTYVTYLRVYDTSNGTDKMTLLVNRGATTGMPGDKVTFVDIYQVPGGRGIVSYAAELYSPFNDGYRTFVLDPRARGGVELDGKTISVTYNKAIACYKVVHRDGTKGVIYVDLNTLKIVPKDSAATASGSVVASSNTTQPVQTSQPAVAKASPVNNTVPSVAAIQESGVLQVAVKSQTTTVSVSNNKIQIQPGWTVVPGNSQLAYQSTGEQGFVLIMDLVTGKITNKPSSQNYLYFGSEQTGVGYVVAPDGLREIYYWHQTSYTTGSICVYNSNTQKWIGEENVTNVLTGPPPMSASPDGQYLTFEYSRDSERAVKVMSLAGPKAKDSYIVIPQASVYGIATIQRVRFVSATRIVVTLGDGSGRIFYVDIQSNGKLVLTLASIPPGWTVVPGSPQLAYQKFGDQGFARIMDLATGAVSDKPNSQNHNDYLIDRTGVGYVITPSGLREIYSWHYHAHDHGGYDIYDPVTRKWTGGVGTVGLLYPSAVSISPDGKYLTFAEKSLKDGINQIGVLLLTGSKTAVHCLDLPKNSGEVKSIRFTSLNRIQVVLKDGRILYADIKADGALVWGKA